MKKIALLLVLLVCSAGWGANWYVDPTNGNDTTGDGSSGSPEKSLKAAVADASSGDTIKLLAGTYNDDTQIWSIDFPAKTLTIEPNTSGSRITLTRTTEGGAGWFRFISDRTGYTLTFNNIDFVDSKSEAIICFWYLEVGGNMTFNSCNFSIATNGSAIVGNTVITNDAIVRKSVMNNCNALLASGTSAVLFSFTSFAQVSITDCNITNNTTTSTREAIEVLNMRGPTSIKDCNIISEYSIVARHYTTSDSTLLISGNKLTSTQDKNGQSIVIGNSVNGTADTIYGAKIINNKISNFLYGILHYANCSDIQDNIIYAVDPIAACGGIKTSIVNNTLVSVKSGGSAAGRGIALGRKYYAKQGTNFDFNKSYTDFSDVNVAVTGGGDECDFNSVLTDRTMLALVTTTNTTTNNSPVPVYYGVVFGATEDTNTITVDKWVKVSDYTTETPADNTYYVSVVRFSNDCYVVNNIIDGGRAGHAMTFDFNPITGSNYVNYNCYVAGTKCLTNLGASAQMSLAALRAKWLVWPWANTESCYNDANSIEADPQFVDVVNGNFKLQVSSPCLNTGKPTAGGGKTSIGAYTAILDAFIISGYAVDSKMLTPLEGILVSPDNNGGPYTSEYYGGGHDTTDAAGYYEVWVDRNWSGNVVPSKYAYTFEPNSIVYTNVTTGIAETQNYVGTLLPYTITGYIKNSREAPIEGILVDANNGGNSDTTDANGYYEVWVDYNWYGTITPSKTHYAFDPNSMSYANVLGDIADQNYTATTIYDLDCDGSIGFGDIAIISGNWLYGPDLPGDLYKDETNTVNFLDFADFANVWGD